MKTSKDNAGRTWTVSAHVDAIKRVRSALDVNLVAPPSSPGRSEAVPG